RGGAAPAGPTPESPERPASAAWRCSSVARAGAGTTTLFRERLPDAPRLVAREHLAGGVAVVLEAQRRLPALLGVVRRAHPVERDRERSVGDEEEAGVRAALAQRPPQRVGVAAGERLRLAERGARDAELRAGLPHAGPVPHARDLGRGERERPA